MLLPSTSDPSSARRSGLSVPALCALWVATLMLLPTLSGCASFGWRQLPPPGGTCVSAVVLDFSQAPRDVERRDTCRNLVYGEKDVETEKDRRGWWGGAQDVWYNENWGYILADLVSDQLRDGGVFNIRSRDDLKYYYADKKEILGTKLNLSGKELDRAVLALNPVNIGREMGVDKVVVGHLVDAELRQNRLAGFYASVARVNISIYDTKTGNLEFSEEFCNIRRASTTYGNLNDIAEQFAMMLKANKGSRVVPAYNFRP